MQKEVALPDKRPLVAFLIGDDLLVLVSAMLQGLIPG